MRRSVIVAAAVTLLAAVTGASGQTAADAAPHFEVASVKASPNPFAPAPGGGPSKLLFGIRVMPGGRVMAVASLQTLILRAYGIKEFQLEGGPKWLTTDYFDISAKAEQETATAADLNAMLRSLLSERFGLRVHVETRQSAVYTLKARLDGKLGPSLKRTSAECERQLEERKRGGPPLPVPSMPSGPQPRIEPACGRTMGMVNAKTGTETYASGGQPLSELVSSLSSQLKAPVIDQTGLTGLFDVLLEFESTRQFANQPPPGLDPNSTDPLPVPLPAALQQQLGLVIEKSIAPLPITIIDAVAPPSAN